MRNSIVKIIRILIVTAIVSLVTVSAIAEGQYRSSAKLYDDLVQHNSTLRQLRVAEKQVELELGSAEDASNSAKSILRRLSELSKFGRSISTSKKLPLMLTRDLVPAQAEYRLEKTKTNTLVTQNSLTISMREMYLSLYSAEKQQKYSNDSLLISEEKLRQREQEYEQGVINGITLKEAQFAYEQILKDCDKGDRDFENRKRSLNALIGTEVDTEWELTLEKKREDKLEDVSYYLKNALQNRAEITDIDQQIALKELEKSKYDWAYDGEFSSSEEDAQEKYEQILRDLERLQVERQIALADIEQEIRIGYKDVKNAYNQINLQWNAVRAQTDQLNKLRAQYNEGKISEVALSEFENGLDRVRDQYEMAIYNYNTRRLKLDYAATIGPAY